MQVAKKRSFLIQKNQIIKNSYVKITSSSASNAIDTMVHPTENTKIITNVMPITSSESSYFGICNEDGLSPCCQYRVFNLNGTFNLYSAESGGKFIALAPFNYWYEIQLSFHNGKTYVKDNSGNTIIEQTVTSTYISPRNMTILIGQNGSFAIKWFKIYDQDVLIRDFYPQIDKKSIPCLFDKISKNRFYCNPTTCMEYYKK